MTVIESIFRLKEHNTTWRTEVAAGLTTYLTMVYIIFVNPEILSQTGMNREAVFVATCLASALATASMGLIANYPIALAPGMGVNTFFAFSVVLGMGYSWQIALAAVFFSGALFLVFSILPVREWLINAIPTSQKMAIAAGVGLFLAVIALTTMGIVVDHPVTLVTIGDLSRPELLLSISGFLLIVILAVRRVTGAIVIAILLTSAIGILGGVSQYNGFFSAPPSLAPVFMQLDFVGAFDLALISVVLAFFFVHLFDTTGTLVSVAHMAGLLDNRGRLPRLDKVFISDSTSVMAGSVLGTSPVSSYVESAAGVNAGGRTGLSALVVAVLFLVSIFLSPLLQTVPGYATAPAILFVGAMMLKNIIHIDWDDLTEYVPAVLVIVIMPLTYSITDGICFGFIAYTVLKLSTGRGRELNGMMVCMTAVFILKYLFLDL